MVTQETWQHLTVLTISSKDAKPETFTDFKFLTHLDTSYPDARVATHKCDGKTITSWSFDGKEAHPKLVACTPIYRTQSNVDFSLRLGLNGNRGLSLLGLNTLHKLMCTAETKEHVTDKEVQRVNLIWCIAFGIADAMLSAPSTMEDVQQVMGTMRRTLAPFSAQYANFLQFIKHAKDTAMSIAPDMRVTIDNNCKLLAVSGMANAMEHTLATEEGLPDLTLTAFESSMHLAETKQDEALYVVLKVLTCETNCIAQCLHANAFVFQDQPVCASCRSPVMRDAIVDGKAHLCPHLFVVVCADCGPCEACKFSESTAPVAPVVDASLIQRKFKRMEIEIKVLREQLRDAKETLARANTECGILQSEMRLQDATSALLAKPVLKMEPRTVSDAELDSKYKKAFEALLEYVKHDQDCFERLNAHTC